MITAQQLKPSSSAAKTEEGSRAGFSIKWEGARLTVEAVTEFAAAQTISYITSHYRYSNPPA